MAFFEYAQDYYGDWLPAQLLLPAGLLIVWVAVLFAGIHLLRRSAGEPVCTEAAARPPHGPAVPRYEIGARLYHWGNFFILLGLIVSGLALLVPRNVDPPRFDWLLIHEIFAVAFIAGLGIHIVAALTRGQPETMWFERRDWRDIKLILANFFGRTRDYPCFGKYDPFQKIYHAFLTLAGAVLIFTGVSLFLSAEVWATFSHEWMRWQRLLHDLGAFAYMAVVVGHIYFGVIPVNWPRLISTFTGTISSYYFRLYHTRSRWTPGQAREDGS